MAILNEDRREVTKQVIDLAGPQGNAFFLLGTASKLAKQLNLDAEAITEEMTKHDYDGLVETFDKHFGDYVDLQR